MLRDLQRDFFALLTGRDAPPAPALVRGDRLANATCRAGIYARMYHDRLIEALRENFPRLAMSYDFEDYLRAHPPTHFSLRNLGESLPAFLEGPLGELAALEWARLDVFDAADVPILTLDQVRADLRLRLVPAHRFVTARHDIAAFWRDPTTPPRRRAQTLLVWRQGVSVFHRPINGAERRMLRTLSIRALPFTEICARVGNAERAAELLGCWIADGILAAQ